MAEDYNAKQATYEAEYQKMYPFQLTQEFHTIRANHNKENMMSDLVKMTALMKVMEERNIPVPGNEGGGGTSNQQRPRPQVNTQLGSNSNSSYGDSGSSINGGKVALGAVILVVGLALTFGGSGGIFYGAILVGIFMIIGGLMGS